jgi:methyl-accepting chemotaxis protein
MLQAQAQSVGLDLWLSLGTTTVIGVVLIVFITLSIIRPLSALQQSTQAIAEGDLTRSLDAGWSDEVGRMSQSMD